MAFDHSDNDDLEDMSDDGGAKGKRAAKQGRGLDRAAKNKAPKDRDGGKKRPADEDDDEEESDEDENESIKGRGRKPTAKNPPKGRGGGKKRAVESDDDDDDEEEESDEDENVSIKQGRGRKQAAKKAPKGRGRGKKRAADEDDEDENDEHAEDSEPEDGEDENPTETEKIDFSNDEWFENTSKICQVCKKTYDTCRDASNCVTGNHRRLRCYICFCFYRNTDTLFRHYESNHRAATCKKDTILCPHCMHSIPFKSVSCHVITSHIAPREEAKKNGTVSTDKRGGKKASSANEGEEESETSEVDDDNEDNESDEENAEPTLPKKMKRKSLSTNDE